MAFFKNDENEIIPESRMTAFADRELAAFLQETPLTIGEADIDWKFSREGDKVFADGAITVPVRLTFKEGNLKNDVIADDLVFIDVEIAGESQLGIRFEKPAKEAPLDPLASVDVNRAVAEAQKKAWD